MIYLPISAQSLFDAFRRDRAEAGKKYHGRFLEVWGPAIGDNSGKPTRAIDFFVDVGLRGFEDVRDSYRRIAAATASGVNGVRCEMRKPTPRPRAEQQIRIRGRCVDPGIGYDALLRDCELIR
jgi:hypothetical protein